MRVRATMVFLCLLAAWGALALIFWGAGAAITPTTHSADLSIVRDIASDRSSALTGLAHALSFIGSGWVLIPAAVVVAGVLAFRRRAKDALTIALSLGAGIGLSSLDKTLVGRPRPPVHRLEHVTSASFPSGHATQSTAFFLALLLAWLAARGGTRARALAITATVLLIVAVALSRVYLGVHYPTDVAAGILLGGAWALLTRRLLCGSTGPAGR